MSAVSLETLQNEVIRDVLNINDINVLKKVKNLLKREERKVPRVEVPSVVSEDEVPYMTKEEILANFDQACKELKLNLEGKLELKKAEDLLDEF